MARSMRSCSGFGVRAGCSKSRARRERPAPASASAPATASAAPPANAPRRIRRRPPTARPKLRPSEAAAAGLGRRQDATRVGTLAQRRRRAEDVRVRRQGPAGVPDASLDESQHGGRRGERRRARALAKGLDYIAAHAPAGMPQLERHRQGRRREGARRETSTAPKRRASRATINTRRSTRPRCATGPSEVMPAHDPSVRAPARQRSARSSGAAARAFHPAPPPRQAARAARAPSQRDDALRARRSGRRHAALDAPLPERGVAGARARAGAHARRRRARAGGCARASCRARSSSAGRRPTPSSPRAGCSSR